MSRNLVRLTRRLQRPVFAWLSLLISAFLTGSLVLTLLSCGSPQTASSSTETTAAQTTSEQAPSQTAQPSTEVTEPSARTTVGNSDLISAKQAMEILLQEARRWSPDAVPLTLGAQPRNSVIQDGLCNYWTGLFYSPSAGEVYGFVYYKDESMQKPQLGRANKPLYQGVKWEVADLMSFWKVDSPEAFHVALQHGLGDIVSLEISLRKVQPDRNPPAEVPESCAAYWR